MKHACRIHKVCLVKVIIGRSKVPHRREMQHCRILQFERQSTLVMLACPHKVALQAPVSLGLLDELVLALSPRPCDQMPGVQATPFSTR